MMFRGGEKSDDNTHESPSDDLADRGRASLVHGVRLIQIQSGRFPALRLTVWPRLGLLANEEDARHEDLSDHGELQWRR